MAREAKTVTAVAEAATETITSLKGFDSNFSCKGFQFEVGKTYTVEGKVIVCQNGFHAVDAEDPFHVWDFYPIIGDDGKLTRYAEVSQSGATDREKDDNKRGTKIASASITINAELSLPDFIRRAVDAIVAKTKGKDESGDYAQIGSSGDYARIGSSGDSARIGSSGYSARIGSSGYSAQIGSSGDSAQIGSSGDYAQIGSSGDYARIGSSGDSARIGSSGYYAQIGSSGDYAQIGSSSDYAQIGSSGDSAKIDATGKDAVIASAGRGTTISGAEGAWVSLAEYDDAGKCVGFADGCIGKDGLKPGVRYIAKGGNLVEV